MKIYNACFYEMRKALDIEPYNFLNDYEQISEKSKDIFLFVCEEEIIGSVACYGTEIDDLIVNKKFQNKGYGKQLLLWGMNYIRQSSNESVSLHVAKWNEKALKLSACSQRKEKTEREETQSREPPQVHHGRCDIVKISIRTDYRSTPN